MKKKLKIALAEDNRFHAVLFEQATKGHYPDAKVSIFVTGATLIDSLAENKYDLVAIDYNLPDMDGLQLISRIHDQQPDLPIVVITGIGSEQVAVEAMKSGASDYVSKTGNFDEVIPRVISQAYHKQRLILKNRRLETKAREIERLETITALVSTLNHEINNPLMAIQGNVELLLEDSAVSDRENNEKLQMIEQSALRIKDITHKMANVMEASIQQTPVGPMFKLKEKRSGRRQKSFQNFAPVDKSD